MKQFLFVSLLFISTISFAQSNSSTSQKQVGLERPYNPQEDAQAKLKQLIAQAQKENKNIMIQAGGNWCIWCLRFDHYWKTHEVLKQIVNQNYLYYHLNWSPENKNEAVFKKFGYPGKKNGYPVFIVLDKNGKLLHIQNSGVLEDGKSYQLDKVKAFFEKWTPKA